MAWGLFISRVVDDLGQIRTAASAPVNGGGKHKQSPPENQRAKKRTEQILGMDSGANRDRLGALAAIGHSKLTFKIGHFWEIQSAGGRKVEFRLFLVKIQTPCPVTTHRRCRSYELSPQSSTEGTQSNAERREFELQKPQKNA